MKTIYILAIFGVLELLLTKTLKYKTELLILYGIYKGVKWLFTFD